MIEANYKNNIVVEKVSATLPTIDTVRGEKGAIEIQREGSRAAVTAKLDDAERDLNKIATGWTNNSVGSYYAGSWDTGSTGNYLEGSWGTTIPTNASKLYIQIASEQQRAQWNAIRPNIAKEGFDVPAIQNIGDKAPNESQLRYFHNNEQEKTIAERLIKIIEAKAGTSLKVRFIPGFEDKVKPNTFEVWLSKDAK